MSAAENLDRARFALLDAWRDLTPAQRTALRGASCFGPASPIAVQPHVNARTVAALQRLDLVCQHRRTLSPLGVLVRDAGLALEDAAAKRKYNRRKAARS